jgi:uncharacterized membrane protein
MTSAEVSEHPVSSATTQRYQWLDILRGAALPAMASYHFMWDLADFGYLDPDFPSTGWPKIYARAIASTFLFLAGFSLVLAHRNGIRWRSFWIRFATIAGAAVLVSVATYFAMPQGWIFFGILHAIAVASLIGLLFLRATPLLTIIVAIILIAVPQFYRFEQLDAPWFWWIGLSARTKISFDYVPLLPWLGPFLIGMAASRISLTSGWLRQNALGISTTNPLKTFFVALGRHSLVFYIVHQPVLIAMLYVFSLVVPAPKVDPGPHYIRSCVQTCKTGQTEEFCTRFCGCTLEKLNALDMLEPLQSGAISVDNDERLNGIAMQCTAESE